MVMDKFEELREPMDMPNPQFPIKIGLSKVKQEGLGLFHHHWHEHLEFLYFTSGEAIIECNSVPYKVKSGDLIVINSNELHYGTSLSSNLSYYVLIADVSILHSQAIDAAESKFITPLIQNRLLIKNHIRDSKEAESCILTINNELQSKQFGYELAVKSELYRLLAFLLRGHTANAIIVNQHHRRLENVERFAPVFTYIEEHFQEDISVEQLSALAGLSRSHFSRLFKELSGQTILQYITAKRLQQAYHLLRHSSLSVSEVAEATGFNDIYYFSRIFKKHKKIAPSFARGE